MPWTCISSVRCCLTEGTAVDKGIRRSRVVEDGRLSRGAYRDVLGDAVALRIEAPRRLLPLPGPQAAVRERLADPDQADVVRVLVHRNERHVQAGDREAPAPLRALLHE